MKKAYRSVSTKMVPVAGILVLFSALAGFVFTGRILPGGIIPAWHVGLAHAAEKDDSKASAKAFLAAYQVFLSPRCVGCHPAGNRPLQGDDEHIHTMHVVRGPEGMGKNGLWCSTCHQDRNLHGTNMPPGAPGWQMPTADMPMTFEGRNPHQLCEQLKDAAQNGHRSPDEIVQHVRESPFVIWAWHPGEGRTPAPLSHEEFVKLLTKWAENGGECPE